MPAPPKSGTVVVPAKKVAKKDAYTLAPLADGRVMITAVKKGLPKEFVPGMILKSISVEGQQVSDITSLEQAEEQRKMASKAGKTVKFTMDGISASGKKPSKDSKVGLSLRREPDVGVVVRKIEENSIFSKTPLAVGQIITSINKVPCPKETKDVIDMLKAAKKDIALTAVDRMDDAVPADDEEPAAEPAPEAAPEAEPAPSKDEDAEPVTPEPSEDEAEEPAPEKDDASDKAAPEPELKPSESQDEDETAKEDSDDASSVGKDRGTSKADVESSEEKKTDEAGSNWLCCAY